MIQQIQHFQWRYLILLLLLGGSLVLAGCANSAGKAQKLVQLNLAPAAAMPDFVHNAPPEAQEAYRFAAANPEMLEHIPCYCGCVAQGHQNNLECYLQPSGAFDVHASYCGVCVDITRDVMEMLRQDKQLVEIREYIDATYSQYGPPTDTGPVPVTPINSASEGD